MEDLKSAKTPTLIPNQIENVAHQPSSPPKSSTLTKCDYVKPPHHPQQDPPLPAPQRPPPPMATSFPPPTFSRAVPEVHGRDKLLEVESGQCPLTVPWRPC